MASGVSEIPTKDEVARVIADGHFQVEPGVSHIYRIVGSQEQEKASGEPVKLLEINSETFPGGIMPIYFGPEPRSGIHYPSVIVEVTPREFAQIKQSRLKLPHGWALGSEIRRKRVR